MDSWMKKVDLKYAKEEGKKEANMETARKLLKKGMEIKDIIDITGITEKQIEILRKSL
jgi:predicted transposase/invertase (TIGR01784 family)